MKASEILHGLADLMAGIEGGVGQNAVPQGTSQVQTATMTPVKVDNTDGANSTTMIPPLQQKIELLKKSLNVDNEFDHGFDQEGGDDLARMKQMAGIKTVATQELANDEPLDI